jgi:dihydrofolate reductase
MWVNERSTDMRRIVVSEFLSIDGVMEDPGGAEGFRHGGWTFAFNDPDGMRYKLDEVLDGAALLLGRVTYEGFAAAWPGRSDDLGFADKMNTMPKYVVSRTLERADWSNSTILRGDVAEEVGALRAGDGGDILVAGSAQLVRALAAADLVDEYRLMVFPIVLGEGKRLFDGLSEPASLGLADVRPLRSGTVILTYHRAPAAVG